MDDVIKKAYAKHQQLVSKKFATPAEFHREDEIILISIRTLLDFYDAVVSGLTQILGRK